MGLTSNIKDKDWVSVRQATAKLGSIKLGPTSSPTYAGLTLTDLTALRLVWSSSAKELVSKDLIDLITGTANRITVSDDAAGGVDITIPDHPVLNGISLKDSSDDVYFYADEDEFYITEKVVVVIVAGNPMGLLLALTYPATP